MSNRSPITYFRTRFGRISTHSHVFRREYRRSEDEVNTTTTKLDFSRWVDERPIVPRTLREIADEVGFPFAAKAVAKIPDSHPAHTVSEVLPDGYVVTIAGECDFQEKGSHVWAPALSKGTPVAAHIPRWILLGDKT